MPFRWDQGAAYQRCLKTLRAQLSTADFDAGWQEGQAWSMEQAINYGLEELPRITGVS